LVLWDSDPVANYMSNSNSESESSFLLCARIFLGARAFVLVATDLMRDDASSSSSSESSPSGVRRSPSGPRGRSRAPHRIRSASSSAIILELNMQ
jgi:hypothetical protein